MSTTELAHNGCYLDENRRARYRDYAIDVDARELAKRLIRADCREDLSRMPDEDFDCYIEEILAEGPDDCAGAIALLYRNICAMASMRERLKNYEDIGTLDECREAMRKGMV